MAVLIEGTNVIIRAEAVNHLYPNGVRGLERDCPNKTFCTDGSIVRLGFMADTDARTYISAMTNQGLTHIAAGRCIDIALLSVERGPETGCDWLNTDHDGRGFNFAWLAGIDPGLIVAPDGIDLDDYKSSLTYYTPEEHDKYLEFLREENNLRVYLDKRSGQIVYAGRTTSLDDEAVEARVDELWDRTFQLEAIADQARTNGDADAGAKVYGELLDIVKEAEALADDRIPKSVYLVGLACRVLEKWSEAELWYRRFADKNPFHPYVWLELTWCLSVLDRMDESLEAARRAHELDPESPAALGNLAAALNGVGKVGEARKFVVKALQIDPDDMKNQQILAFLNDQVRESPEKP